MTDVITNKPLRVTVIGTARPYIELAFSQLEDVQRLLDAQAIHYWVDDMVISFNGGPEMAIIHLAREVNPAAVQTILDSIP